MNGDIERLRQRAIYKLTMRYGKPFVRFNMTPMHTTNALIPKQVQALTIKIKESNDLQTMQRLAKAAEDIFDRRIEPEAIETILMAAAKKGKSQTLQPIPESDTSSSSDESDDSEDTSSSDYEETKSDEEEETKSDDEKDTQKEKKKSKRKKMIKNAMEDIKKIKETNIPLRYKEAIDNLSEDLREYHLQQNRNKSKELNEKQRQIEGLQRKNQKLFAANQDLQTKYKELKEELELVKQQQDTNAVDDEIKENFIKNRISKEDNEEIEALKQEIDALVQENFNLKEKTTGTGQAAIKRLEQERKDCNETKDALKVAVGFAEKLDESDKVIIAEREREIERLKAEVEELKLDIEVKEEDHENFLNQVQYENEKAEQELKEKLTEQLTRNQELQNEIINLKRSQGISAQRRAVILSQTEDDDPVLAASLAEGLIPALPTIRVPERHEL